MAAHTVNKLTAIFVRKAKEPGKYGDGNGLFLHVKLSGAKHWVQTYTLKKNDFITEMKSVHEVGSSVACQGCSQQREQLSFVLAH